MPPLSSPNPKRDDSLSYNLAVVRASSLLVSAIVMTSGLLHYTTTAHVTAGRRTAHDVVSSLFANAIEDRRLISTLVTAHATSICSLLVLIGQYRNSSEGTEITRFRSVFINLCQIIVPLELMVSWIFCILFDVHTKRIFEKKSSFHLSDYQLFSNICIGNQEEMVSMQCSVVTFTHICKYIVGLLLLVELLLVSVRAYKRLVVQREGGIRLYDVEVAEDTKMEFSTMS
jgi:hypothetical protein